MNKAEATKKLNFTAGARPAAQQHSIIAVRGAGLLTNEDRSTCRGLIEVSTEMASTCGEMNEA